MLNRYHFIFEIDRNYLYLPYTIILGIHDYSNFKYRQPTRLFGAHGY